MKIQKAVESVKKFLHREHFFFNHSWTEWEEKGLKEMMVPLYHFGRYNEMVFRAGREVMVYESTCRWCGRVDNKFNGPTGETLWIEKEA